MSNARSNRFKYNHENISKISHQLDFVPLKASEDETVLPLRSKKETVIKRKKGSRKKKKNLAAFRSSISAGLDSLLKSKDLSFENEILNQQQPIRRRKRKLRGKRRHRHKKQRKGRGKI